VICLRPVIRATASTGERYFGPVRCVAVAAALGSASHRPTLALPSTVHVVAILVRPVFVGTGPVSGMSRRCARRSFVRVVDIRSVLYGRCCVGCVALRCLEPARWLCDWASRS